MPKSPYLLGIDLGTMLIKAVIFTADGEEVCSNGIEVGVDYPRPGWAEQDPEMLWRTTCRVIKELLKKAPITPEDIVGVSLTGQMHGTFLVDREGRPARRRAIIWLDSRSKELMNNFYRQGIADTIYDISGWRLITSMQVLHLKWLLENERDVIDKAEYFMACKDYIRYKLTGEAAMDYTDASVTGLMDLRRASWSDEILEVTGIPGRILPELKGSWDIGGEVTREASEETGLREGTPVAVGAGDICATALGAGAINPGQLTAIIGTAGIYELTVNRPLLDGRRTYSVAYHAVPGKWLLEAVQMTAGAALRWFKDEFCQEEVREAGESGVSPYVILDEKAKNSSVGSNGVIFHPFLQGERSPFVNPDARGVFFGLGLWTKKGDLIRAILEGVAMAAKDNIEVFKKRGVTVNEIRMTGGGAKSPLWCQIMSDALETRILVPKIKECGALGSAIEAGVAAKIFKNPEEGVQRMVKIEKEYEPSRENAEKYQKLFKLYKKIYKALWDIYGEASKIYSSI